VGAERKGAHCRIQKKRVMKGDHTMKIMDGVQCSKEGGKGKKLRKNGDGGRSARISPPNKAGKKSSGHNPQVKRKRAAHAIKMNYNAET